MTDNNVTARLADDARGLQFHYPSGILPVNPNSPDGSEYQLLVESFEGEDRLGRLFEYRIDLFSETMDVDFNKIVGKNVSVSMETKADIPVRFFNGYITEFTFRGSAGRFGRFSATIRPWFWFLSRTSNCRIFQEKTTPEIIEKIFRDNGLTHFRNELRDTYQKRDYCVQYRESDLDFVSRLMELEGIYYYFQHEERKHTLVMVDRPSAHVENPGYAQVPYYHSTDNRYLGQGEYLQDWMLRQAIVPTEFSQRDYDFTKPNADLTTKSGLFNTQTHDNPLSKTEVFDYPGDFSEENVGTQNTRVLSETWETQGLRAFASGIARGMVAGCVFELTDYPHDPQNQPYLVVSVHHQIYGDKAASGSGEDREFYRCHIEVVKKDWPYRSQRITPKPMIRGPQTAKVVGKSGEEIWCDEYGRVKVQFHWDREGVSDENTTCWIRVSQLWAGKNWGGMHIPRIGQEVVVSFLEGDPDQPLITGSVYNADHMPPHELPKHKTRSGIQSRSTKGANADNFNELRFEDKKGEEEVYLQAEKDLKKFVKNDETRVVANTRSTTIGLKDNEFPKKAPEEKGGEVEFLKISGDVLHHIENGNVTQTVTTGDIHREAEAGNVLEEALQSIEFKVGQSSILLEPSKITIKSLEVKVEGSMKAEIKSDLNVSIESSVQTNLKGTMTTVEGSGIAQVKGGLVKIN